MRNSSRIHGRMQRLLAALLVALCCLASPALAELDDEVVVIQLKWLHQFQFAGYYAALERGYFADEGLRVELRERRPGLDPVEQVLQGKAHYGVTDSVLLKHHVRGAPVVIVAAIMQHSANALLTLEGAGLLMPHDLMDRSIGVPDNGVDAIDLQAMLAEGGITPRRQHRLGWDERIRALLAREIDAIAVYATNEPFVLREMGFGVELISPRHFGVDVYGDMLFTSQDEATRSPERVAAMRRAVLRGWTYALD
jgi:polar amino acid transport system substrate-binding protein